jgi:hypothetical protein
MKAKVNIDREKISDAEIRARKDFSSVLQQYNTAGHTQAASRSLFRSKGFLATFLTLTLLTLSFLTWFSLRPDENAIKFSAITVKQTKLAKEEALAVVAAPAPAGIKFAAHLKKLDIPFQNYKMDASAGGEFKSSKGARIRIPKNAFADANGKALKGEVELRFREFNSPVDFFLGGVPMSYDSAGVRYQIESAGMVELLGYKDLKPVYIIPGKKVEIEVDAKASGPSYNVYRLDTSTCNWVYAGKDKVRKLDKNELVSHANTSPQTFDALPEVKKLDEKIADLKQECNQKLAQIPATGAMPQEPHKANPANKHWTPDVDVSEFPELSKFKSTVFEVTPESKPLSEDTYLTTWEDITITPAETTQKGQTYKIVLKKGKQSLDITAYPVLEGKEYDAALKAYRAQLDKYSQAANGNAESEKKIKSDYDKEETALGNKRRELEKAFAEQSKHASFDAEKEKKVVHIFELSGFGIFGCDALHAYPTGAIASIKLLGQDGKILPCQTVYLVDASKNSLYTYSSPIIAKFQYDPASRNMIWTVANGKLYMLRASEFSSIGKNIETEIKLTAVDAELRDADAVKAFMGI